MRPTYPKANDLYISSDVGLNDSVIQWCQKFLGYVPAITEIYEETKSLIEYGERSISLVCSIPVHYAEFLKDEDATIFCLKFANEDKT